MTFGVHRYVPSKTLNEFIYVLGKNVVQVTKLQVKLEETGCISTHGV